MVNSNSLPPQNIEAEESILGGILLDPEAIGRVVDFMVADAFYVKAHRDIYETALKLLCRRALGTHLIRGLLF
jgi:replicative DNA helicase